MTMIEEWGNKSPTEEKIEEARRGSDLGQHGQSPPADPSPPYCTCGHGAKAHDPWGCVACGGTSMCGTVQIERQTEGGVSWFSCLHCGASFPDYLARGHRCP